MNYYNEIKTKLIENENYARIKDYSKEMYKLTTYYEIGKILTEAGKSYGDNVIGKYSKRLQVEVNKKYNERTLYRMRKTYELFSKEKLTPLVSKLNWSHCIVLITLKDIEKIIYYSKQVGQRNLTKRELEKIIKNKEYERLDDKTKLKLSSQEQPTIQESIKNPIIISNSKNNPIITEKILKEIILENLDKFLLELGNKFCYMGNEYKIKIGDRYNYIDILLYNVEYNCYVVIELKITELKKEHIGQIQTYMNYIDTNLKTINQDKTIGIIICKKDNHFIMEYCSDPKIISREYIIK